METWTVYILKCSDGKKYTGCTSDFAKRLIRHSKGFVVSTKYRLPVTVVVTIIFYDKCKAFDFEKYLKSGSGRSFSGRHFFES